MEAQSLSTCNQCGKKFQRKAHLLRHQQQHSGERPYSCKFCAKTFKRSDVLRDHFSRCDRRGTAAIPNSLERGRKRHACDECSRLKVKCDNHVPCRKCQEFGRTCVKTRSGGASSPEQASTPSASASTPDTPSDRNSIGFLLNLPGESDSFMREFPKSSTMSPSNPTTEIAAIPSMAESYEAATGELQNDESEMTQENNLAVFLSHLEFQTTFERQTNGWQPPSETIIPWAAGTQFPNIRNQRVLDQRVFDLRDKLRYTAASQSAPDLPPRELLDAIEMITSNILTKFLGLYFKHWHCHAPMVHEPTFNPCNVALPLILALMGLGGMYSKEPEEVAKLKLLLDTIETFIYSIPGLNDEYDAPGRMYLRHGTEASEEWQQYQLEELQGAYLVIVWQYWTGNMIARSRVRQQRFSRVVAVFHHLELPTVQHSPDVIQDQASFTRWIRTESSIRTAGIATMLDNAFGIFNNIPPRLQWSEIDLPFPSSDIYYKLSSFEEMRSKNLYPQQKMKIKEAFLVLFSPPELAHEELDILKRGCLTALDMQMLIHFLYTHIWTSTFNSPAHSLPGTTITSLTNPFKNALANWKHMWDTIRAASEESEWNKLGFQSTAETYYDAVNAIIGVFERMDGRVPVMKSDCAKGEHLRRLLSL